MGGIVREACIMWWRLVATAFNVSSDVELFA